MSGELSSSNYFHKNLLQGYDLILFQMQKVVSPQTWQNHWLCWIQDHTFLISDTLIGYPIIWSPQEGVDCAGWALLRVLSLTLCLIGRGGVAVDGNLGMHNVKTSGGTTLQSMMNTKLSEQRFWHCHENGLIKTIQTIPHNLHVSVKLTSLYCGLRIILVYPTPQ